VYLQCPILSNVVIIMFLYKEEEEEEEEEEEDGDGDLQVNCRDDCMKMSITHVIVSPRSSYRLLHVRRVP